MNKIKHYLQSVCLLLSTCILTACPPDEPDDYLEATSNKVELENGIGQVNIKSNVSWSITKIPLWLTSSVFQGKGDIVLTLTESEKNPNPTAREGILVVQCTFNPNLTTSITVVQPGTSTPPPDRSSIKVTPNELHFDSAVEAKSVMVEANNSWSMSTPTYEDSETNWLTLIPEPANDFDAGTQIIAIKASENASPSERKATITFTCGTAKAIVTVIQQGTASYINVDKSALDFEKEAGSDSFSITSNVSWTVTSDADWCRVSPANGSNNGAVSVNVDANTGSTERKTTITVKGDGMTRTIEVTQAGEATLTVSKTALGFDKEAGSNSFTITSNVSWTVTSNASWCRVSPANGSNNGAVSVNVDANTGSTERKATITVKGGGMTKTVEVTQAGEATLAVNKTALSFEKDAGSNSFTITSNVSWTVTSNASWCRVSPANGSNNGTVSVNVDANTGSTERKATITVKGGGMTRTIEVTQAGEATLTVSKTALGFEKEAGSNSFTIMSNVSWTVTSNASWCRVSPASGSNNGAVSVNVDANTGSTERKATITVKGGGMTRTVEVTQAGEATLTVSKTALGFDKDAGSNSFTITSNVSWTVTSNASWCRVSPANGSNNGAVSVNVDANTGSTERKATITVKGGGMTRTVEVTQAGEATLTVSKTALGFDKDAGSNSFTITSNVSWTVTSNASWCRVSPANGSNNGAVSVNVDANTGSTERKATITVKGGSMTRTVEVTQAGEATLAVNKTALSFEKEAGSNSFTITSNVSWTVTSNASWCRVSPANGSNNGAVSVNVDANTGSTERKATITVKGGGITRTISAIQAPTTPDYYVFVNPTSLSFNSNNGSENVIVTSNDSWTITSSDASWCTVSPSSGTNNGSFTVKVTKNTTNAQRTATITVTGSNSGKKATMQVSQEKNNVPGEDDNPLPNYSKRK